MRRATWILWLMLALLPLRGWAMAAMGLPAAGPTSVVLSAEADAAPAMAPCHQPAADASDADGASCLACDWCHAALALPARVVLDGVHAPAAPPRVQPARDTGRPPIGGLDRPPRTRLA
jgi:hypothetical protein